MKLPHGFLWMALATALVTPGEARATKPQSLDGLPPPQKQQRRRAARSASTNVNLASPCGRHQVNVKSGALYVDGQRVHPARGSVSFVGVPQWRADGEAVAWLERQEGRARLVVLPVLGGDADPLPWVLPGLSPGDRIFWVSRTRVVVGPDILHPRAAASWTL